MAGLSWGQLFTAVLGGVAASSERRAQRDDTREGAEAAGRENRRTASFENDLEYFRNQQLRHERGRSLDTNYNQFSTVRNFAPNFKPGTGLDAMPTKPKPGDY